MITGKLDSHLFMRSIVPYAAVLVATSSMYIVVDLFSNIGRISSSLSSGFSLTDLAILYLLKLPAILLVIIPLVQSIALSFATLGFIRRKEYIVTLSAGIGMRRMSVPFLAAGLLFAVASFVVAEFVVPSVSSIESEYDARLFSRTPELRDVVTLESNGDTRYLYHLDFLVRANDTLHATGFHCFIATDDERSEIHASAGTYRQGTGKWILTGGKLLAYDNYGERQTSACDSLDTSLPSAGYLSQLEPQSFGMADLLTLSGTPKFSYEFHRRMAMPLALFFLALVIVPLSFSLSSGGMFASLGTAIFVALIFFVVDFLVSAAFGDSRPCAVWVTPIIFGFAGLRSILRIPT